MDFMGMSLHNNAFFPLYEAREFLCTVSPSADAEKRASVYFRNPGDHCLPVAAVSFSTLLCVKKPSKSP